MSNLGRLEQVNLRDVWKHEATDFSAWLAKPENLLLLAQQLGIEIELIGTEVPIGRFKIDILGKEPNTNEKIIIENQLESTNHDHLGKVITYAAGLDARYLIWIVKDVLAEHQKALEWLNEHLDAEIRCFLIRIEVWKIGDSVPAPRFEIVSVKNDWVASIKNSANNSGLSPIKIKQLEFWTEFRDFVKEIDSGIKINKPAPQHWINFSMGNSLAHISLTMNTQKKCFTVQLYIPDNKTLFTFLRDNEEEITGRFQSKPQWFEANVASGLYIQLDVKDTFDESRRQEFFDWLYQNVLKFKEVFGPYIQDFRSNA